MTIKSKRFTKGIITKPTDNVTSEEGEQRTDKTAKEQKVYLDGSERTVVTKDQVQELTNKTIDATAATGTNTLSADAVDITYSDLEDPLADDPNFTLGATNVQEAIDVIRTRLDAQNEASEIKYDATDSGLNTGDANSNVKAAIDDLDDNVDDLITLSGVGENTTDLGAFDHGIIPASSTVRGALQALESGIDTNAQNISDNTDSINGNTSAISNVSANLFTHENAFVDVHGVGLDNDVVGTGTAQELSNKTMTDELKFKKLGATPTVLGTDEVSIYPKSDGKFYKLTNDGVSLIEEELGTGGGGTFFTVTQNNTFSVGQGIYHNSGTGLFEKASADDANKLAYYVVTEASATEFTAADFGRVEIPSHGYAVGSYYFLTNNPVNAGDAVNTEPTTGFSNPLFYVEDANTLQIKVYRPSAVGQQINLDDLGDVDTTTTTPNNGYILEYSDGAWTPVAPSAGGEVNTASNLGAAPDVAIFSGKVGEDLQFKRLSAGDNVTLTDNGTHITIDSPDTDTGETNTASNLEIDSPTSKGVFSVKVGEDLRFKNIKAGTNVSLTADATSITINSTGGGGASVLDDLSDVTITGTPGTGEVLAYNGAEWVPTTPTSGGGGGATVISAGGNLDQATYDGDVILLGNATMLNSVVIRGDLRFIGSSNSLDNGFNGYNLTVHGNVYGNSSIIDLSGLVPSANGGNFTCYGSVYLSSISTFTATASGFAVGTSGSVSINGDYYYPTSGNIYTTGGDSKIAGNSPSNGGTIFIGGNAEFNIIQSSGGNSTESCNLQAGNGGDITIRGNAKSYNTDQIFGTNKYRAIDFSGGHSKTSNTNVSAGNAGSLFIGGDLYLAGGFNGTGGNSTDTVGGVGGQGGTVVVEGATSINSGADISGGDALSAAGNADQTGNIIFRGHFNCRGTFKANGGNSTFAGGGNAILAVFFYSNVNINQLQLIGGGAASGFRKGGGCPNCLLQGGGSIETINIRDGGGLGNESLVAAKVSFEKGHYNVKEILTTSKSANKQRITGIYSSLKVHTTLLNVSDYTNFNNNYITTPSVDIDSIYVFGGTSDVIKKSAAYVDAGTTYTP